MSLSRNELCAFAILLSIAASALAQSNPEKPVVPAQPNLLTNRSLERTGFQQAGHYDPRFDLRTDFVMAYGVGPAMAETLKRWGEAGYVLQAMTGVAWGSYQDYLDGKVDGRPHWDEAQVDAAGKRVMHGGGIPYMVPTIAFSKYLEGEIRRLIDAGVVAIHLEEPEFWAHSGFSKAFQREWQIYYNEPWQRPDSSCDAQYRASKLKYYLYRRTLDRLCSAMKEYALVKYDRPVRFYVPTHSLINYTEWGIVSPESSLVDLPGVDGCIAQVWTGTARTPNVYQGRAAERTFESAFLEYGVMQELVRGTGRRMWFLHDPVEDDPRHTWDDYRDNYIRTLVASLLQPEVCHYEVAPWPSRVMLGRFPQGSPDARGIAADYATMLAVVFNQLRDMDQKQVSWEGASQGVGVLLADSAMFQRAEPAFTAGTVDKPDDPTRPTKSEVHRLSGFFGMALPLVKHGIPVRPVQLDNVTRVPGYLDHSKLLLLSYEFMKPLQPAIHQALAEWVNNGGTLVYVGADTDPFRQVREWWNQSAAAYAAPSEHLFERLGVGRNPKQGEYRVGKGLLIVERKHPAWFSRSAEGSDRLLELVRRGMQAAGAPLVERNYLQLRRGPYLIAAVLDESGLGTGSFFSPGHHAQHGRAEKCACPLTAKADGAPTARGLSQVSSDETGTVPFRPLRLHGRMIDLLDARLPVRDEVVVRPGQQAWLLDLARVTAKPPAVLAAAGRIESWSPSDGGVHYTITSPEGINVVARILLPSAPKTIAIDGKACTSLQWHEPSKTVLVSHAGHPKPVEVAITW